MTPLTAVIVSALLIACMAFVAYTVRVWWEKYFQKPRADMYYDLSGPDGPVADSDEGYRMSNDEIDEENKG